MVWQSDLGVEFLVYEENALLLPCTLLAYHLGDDREEPRGGTPLAGIQKVWRRNYLERLVKGLMIGKKHIQSSRR